jgi:hypothetical protein
MCTVAYVSAALQGCTKNLDIAGAYGAMDHTVYALGATIVASPIVVEDEDSPNFSGFVLLSGGYVYIHVDSGKREVTVQMHYPKFLQVTETLGNLAKYFECDDVSLRTAGPM